MCNPEIRKAVDAAFKRLRKQGYRARANFLCCGSCAHGELCTHDRYVFWHQQANDRTFGRRGEPITPANPLHLGWSGDGEVIASALRAAGLIVAWDGTDDQCVMVTGRQQ